jgi:hypothetical protein
MLAIRDVSADVDIFRTGYWGGQQCSAFDVLPVAALSGMNGLPNRRLASHVAHVDPCVEGLPKSDATAPAVKVPLPSSMKPRH